MTRLQIGFSVRSGTEVRLVQRGRPLSMMPVEYLTPAVEDRAVEVQALLAANRAAWLHQLTATHTPTGRLLGWGGREGKAMIATLRHRLVRVPPA